MYQFSSYVLIASILVRVGVLEIAHAICMPQCGHVILGTSQSDDCGQYDCGVYDCGLSTGLTMSLVWLIGMCMSSVCSVSLWLSFISLFFCPPPPSRVLSSYIAIALLQVMGLRR
jgi:hypothetical protein